MVSSKEETVKSVEMKPINGNHVHDEDDDDEVPVVIPPDGGELFIDIFSFLQN